MELCVRMRVNSACCLTNCAGPTKSVRASVSWLHPKQFARVGRISTGCVASKAIQNRGFNFSATGPVQNCGGGSGGGGDNGNTGGGGGGGDGDSSPEPRGNHNVVALALAGLALFLLQQQQAALALSGGDSRGGIWEVKGGRWKYLVPHPERDEYVVSAVKNSEEEALAYEKELTGEAEQLQQQQQRHIQQGVESVVTRFVELGKQLLLPDGYPRSVTDDYMEYTLWRMGQVIASQINGVLTTQVLLQLSNSHVCSDAMVEMEDSQLVPHQLQSF